MKVVLLGYPHEWESVDNQSICRGSGRMSDWPAISSISPMKGREREVIYPGSLVEHPAIDAHHC